MRAGSSPRVWGQVTNGGAVGVRNRIIPTRVGTRINHRGVAVDMEDHPHACGDKAAGFKSRRISKGSSPRVWGQGLRAFLKQLHPVDHPHACGDKTGLDNPNSVAQGSSPRVWGQVILSSYGIQRERIIPTRVGTRAINIFQNITA